MVVVAQPEDLGIDDPGGQPYTPGMHKRSSRAPDADRLTESIVHDSTQTAAEARPEKNPAAVALGRLGGLKGGPARAASLTATKRKRIAKRAAEARWNKTKGLEP